MDNTPKGSKYQIGQIVAQGGMGAILRAQDLQLERPVAMKVMLRAGQSSEDSQQRFLREAKVLARLEHPNIVPVHELGRDAQGQVFYTMKFVHGDSLHAVLKGIKAGDAETIAKYPLNHLLTIFQKICDAIAFAHSKGIIHRDLKPANIMIGEYGEVLVMDWGLAKDIREPEDAEEKAESGKQKAEIGDGAGVAEGLTLPGAVMGTPNFMAPEQAAGRVEDQDQRTDIFALGGILYNILTLHTPVRGDTVKELLGKIQKGYIAPPVYYNHSREMEVNGETQIEQPNLPHCPGGQVPESLSAVAMKALALKRADRYQFVSELRRDVELFLEGRSVTAQPDTLPQAFWKLIKRNQGVSATILTAAIILLTMGTLFTYDNAKRRRLAETARDHQRQTALTASERFARQAALAAEGSRWEEAQQRVTDARVVCPDGPWEAYAKGRIAQVKGEHQTALKLFGDALKADASQAEIKSALAKSIALLEQIAAARKALTNMSKLEDWEALEAAGNTLAEARNWREAEQAYAQCLLAVGTKAPKAEVEAKLKGARAWIACEGFYESIRDLPPREQIRRVEQKLSEIHGEPKVIEPLHGRLVEQGVWRAADLGVYNVKSTVTIYLQPLFRMPLTELYLIHQQVRDLSPLRGMPLKSLDLSSCKYLRDLSPLKGMPMESLRCGDTQVNDLSPLKGMPLHSLNCSSTLIGDLRPLADMPLQRLWFRGTQVSDLRPLAGMPLTTVDCSHTAVSDLAPLKGMPLTELYCVGTKVADLTPLNGMNLEALMFSPENINKGMGLVRGMKSLKRISGNWNDSWVTPAEFWKTYDARKKK